MRARMMFSALLGLVMVVALVGTSCAPAAATPEKSKKMAVNMGTTSAASSLYIYGIALAKVINEGAPELSVTALETGGSQDNNRRIREGEIKIASIMSYGSVYEAWAGLGIWAGKPFRRIRQLPSYGTKQYGQIVRADSGIMKPEDLAGKPFSAMAGSYTETSSREIYGTLGIKPDWKPSSTSEAVTNIKDRRWVGYSKALGGLRDLDASTLDIMSGTEIRLLSFTREQMQKAKAAFPQHEWIVVPANAYRQLKSHPEIICFGAGAGTMVLDDMPAEITYKITKAMIEKQQYLATVYPGAGEIEHGKFEIDTLMGFPDPPQMAVGFVWWAQEKGIQVPQKLIPPEYKPRK